MDELEILRTIRRGEATPDDDALIRGQARLERALAQRSQATGTSGRAAPGQRPARLQPRPTPREPRRARRSLGFTFGGVAAAAALGIGIAVLAPGATAPQAEAVEILTQAADRLRTSELRLADSEVLLVEEVAEGLSEARIPGTTTDVPGQSIKYRDTETVVTRVPADRSGDWLVTRSGRELVEVLDPHGVADPERVVREELGGASSQPGAGEEVWPGGVPPWSKTDPLRRDAPTDLEGLRAHIRKAVAGHEGPEDESVFEWLLPVLSNPAAPAELRATGFELLAENATITARIGTERTISMEINNGTSRRDLVFDSEGELFEVREVLLGESSWLAGLEPGTVLASIRINSTVIDGEPAA